jgi:predicted dehydrogenase
MSPSIRIGMIGASWYADGQHLPSLKSHPQAEVVALCARSRERADPLAQKYGIPHVYTDYETMLVEANLDAVVVAVPDDEHYPITMAAIDAGLHVICEKPLAYTLEQARAMAARADERGVQHMTFFTLRWLPHTRFLYELIQSGYVGRIYHCDFSYASGGGRSGEYRWRFDGDRANGIMGDLGSHLLDLARWLVGDFAEVSADLGTYGQRPGTPANDVASLTLKTVNGAQVHVHASAVAHVGPGNLQQRIRIYGEEGTLEANFFFGNFGGVGVWQEVRGARKDQLAVEPIPIPDHIWGTVDRNDPLSVFNHQSAGDRYFIDCLLAGQAVTPNFHDGVAVQAVLDAAHLSQRTGQRVSLV